MPTTVIKSPTIGKIAAQTLQSASRFSIRGITSRGIFTLVDDRTIVFLSREAYKGPLIVNLPWDTAALEPITLASHGSIGGNCFRFDDLDLTIDCSDADIWSALTIYNPTLLPKKLPSDERIVDFLRDMLEKSDNELVAAVLCSFSSADIPCPEVDAELSDQIKKLSTALRDGSVDAVAQSAHYFAGRGRGLTPSGDDFLLGIVYGLFSLHDRLTPNQAALIQLMVEAVSRRSTLISANLIECSADGEVDERIGKAFYALFDPARPVALQAAKSLATWGSSSGLDAAAGFCLFLKCMIIIDVGCDDYTHY